MAKDNYIAGVNIGTDARIGTDGQTALGQRNGPFDVSVHVKVFIAGEISPDDDGLANDGGTFGWLHVLFVS